MKRYCKPLVVSCTLVAALFLTITRRGPDGGIGISAHLPSRAAPQRAAKNYDLSALKVFRVVLGRVTESYVEPARIKPRRMLLSALHAVERNVAEVRVKESKDNKRVQVRVQDVSRTFNISKVDSPWALSAVIRTILRFVQPHLHASSDIRDVEYAAINGMLSTLDPHSVLLKPDIYNEMKLSTRGQFGGLGIVISMIRGVLTVMNPMKGTPAAAAGINACDQILKIDRESTVNMTLNQAVKRLRGRPGTQVTITIKREGWSRPVRKTLTRAVIKVDSVSSRMLARKIAYIRLSSFQGNSFDDIRGHLKKLKKKGMRGLVLDLRNNPGGLLDQAIKISDLFIESGTVLTTVSHAGKRREEKRAHREGTEGRYPLAVLVNGGSASASEIVAGAVKHLDRGVIIGSNTFGKGSVQVLYDNDDGSALKLTIAQYLTPGDISIQTVGITPDIATLPLTARADLVALRGELSTPREKDLRRHLTHRNVRRNDKPAATLRYLATASQKNQGKGKRRKKATPPAPGKNLCLYPDRVCKPPEDDTFVADFQIKLARDLLARGKGWRRSAVLGTAASFLARVQRREEQRLVVALKQLGIDWQAAPKGAAAASGSPKLAVAVSTAPGGGQARACRRLRLKVTATNVGKSAAYRLRATTKSTNRLFSKHELAFGKLDPGATRSWVVPIDVRDAPTRVDEVTLKFTDARGTRYQPHRFQMSVKGAERPVFAYGYQLIDDIRGNHDGRPQRGETVRLFVNVKNTGKGAAFRTMTRLKNLAGRGISLRKGRFVLGRLEPNKSKTASFTFDIEPGCGDAFKVELIVIDEGLREYVAEKLTFKVAPAGAGPTSAKGAARVVKRRVQLRSWGAASAPAVGYAKRGAVFPVLGKTAEGWLRVKAAPGRAAFVAPADVVSARGRARGRFVPRLQVTPPRIALKVPAHATDKAAITIKGTAVDESRVTDLFIFVRNRDAKVESRKVFYRSNRKAADRRKMAFSAAVPLWPGANYVTVFARENNEVQATETVVILRRAKGKGVKQIKAAAVPGRRGRGAR